MSLALCLLGLASILAAHAPQPNKLHRFPHAVEMPWKRAPRRHVETPTLVISSRVVGWITRFAPPPPPSCVFYFVLAQGRRWVLPWQPSQSQVNSPMLVCNHRAFKSLSQKISQMPTGGEEFTALQMNLSRGES